MRKVVYGISVLVVLAVGAGAAARQGWIPGLNQDTGPTLPASQVEPPPSGPGLKLRTPASPPHVLDAAPRHVRVRTAAVSKALGSAVHAKALGKHLGLVVEPLGSKRPVYEDGSRAVVTPASTLKLLTTVAALHALGPGYRFDTRVVAGQTRRSIILVGGGDPLLTAARPSPAAAATAYPHQASLQDLARTTAKTLKSKGVQAVHLSYDTSLYSGPAVSPSWEPSYVPDDVVSPIVALWVDEGRKVDGLAARSADPAAEAARRFGIFLGRSGVTVHGAADQTQARPAAHTIASVRSAPLAEIVQHILELSDNEGAETLLRQVAIATGKPASFTGGVVAVKKQLSGLGVDLHGVSVHDGSGLSRHDRLPIRVLADVLQLAASHSHPELRSVISGLPVAGFTGSLAFRFADDAPAGLGLVRAKTGTLSGVHALAGVVMTSRGTPLVFVAVADRVRLARTLDARDQLDTIATRLAGCRC